MPGELSPGFCWLISFKLCLGVMTNEEIDESEVTYREVPGYPGYRVGSDGSVWSQWIRRKREMQKEWTRLKPCPRPNGYYKVTLWRDGVGSDTSIHRLVCTLFHGACPDGMQAAHENGIRSDNRADNLSWKTPVGNSADRIRHGTACTWTKGESHGMAKLTDDKVREIFRLRNTGLSQLAIGRLVGISQTVVGRVLSGKMWNHVKHEQAGVT